jgi:hypothetical protein
MLAAADVSEFCPHGRDRLNSCGGFKFSCRYFNRKNPVPHMTELAKEACRAGWI